MADPISIASILAKWALYVGVLGCTGSAFCAALFRVEIRQSLIASFAGIGVLCAILSFALKGSALTGDMSGVVDAEMLGLLWQTQSGVALRWQLIGLALMLVGLFRLRFARVLQIFGGVLALCGLAAIGHVHDREVPVMLYSLVLHLICAATWIGILIPLHRLASDPEQAEAAAWLGERFGQVAMVFVPLLLVAGGYMAYGLTGSVAVMLTSGYGQVLLAKVALVAALLALAALNKLRFVPGLRAGDISAAHGLVRTIKAEAGLMAVILLVTAILTTSVAPPSLH